MPADAVLEPDSLNNCCKVWKDKYTKLEEKRNALRQAVKLLEQQINKVQAESINLKKAYEEEKAQKIVKGENDLSSGVHLEKEIVALKSEIFSLQQKKNQCASKEVELLKSHVSERDTEICKLRELLETEKRKAESERKNALVCKKEAAEAHRLIKSEKGRVDKHCSIAADKTKEYMLQLEVLEKKADELKLKLATETTMLQDTCKKLEEERKKTIKEKKRADLEMSKAKGQQMLAQENEKMADKEKTRAESLFQQLEEKRGMVEKLQKQVEEILATKQMEKAPDAQRNKRVNVETIKKNGRLQSETLLTEADESIFVNSPKFVVGNRNVDTETREKTTVNNPELKKAAYLKELAGINKKKPMAENDLIDLMSHDIEENKRKVADLYKQLQKLTSSRKLIGAADKAVVAEKEMKLLRKQLKIEKMKSKHFKREVELEKSQNIVLKQELGRIKLEFVQYLHRLDILSKSFPNDGECLNDLEKSGNVASVQRFNPPKKSRNQELMQILPDPYKLAQKNLTPLDSCGGNWASSVTGIDSKLKSLLGDSNKKMLHSCAIDSSTASFSDRQLVGSQERGAFSFSTSATWVEDNLNVQPSRSNFSNEFPKCNKSLAVVAENSVRSPLKSDDKRRIDENRRKRKRVPDAVGCVENLCSGNKKLHKQLEEKVFFLHEKRGREKSFRKGECQLLDIHGNALGDHRRLQKIPCKEGIGRQPICNHVKIKTKLIGTELFGAANVIKQSSQPHNNLLANNHSYVEADIESMVEAVDDDYMKLLDLDNNADEEQYRRAIETPMSPTLPEIQVGNIESLDSDNIKPLAERYCERLPDDKESNVQSYSYDVINAEIKSNLLKSNTSASSHPELINISEGLVDSVGLTRKDNNISFDIVQSNKMSAKGFQYSDAEMDLQSAYENIPAYCVVFSSIKSDSDISIVLSSVNNCIARCFEIAQKEWAVGKILLALRIEEKLSSREKASVFFSLFLINFCSTAMDKFGSFLSWNSNSSLDLFRDYLDRVMADPEIRSLFTELNFLDELLLLVEDFLIAGNIFQCMDIDHCSRIEVFLGSKNKVYSLAPASAYHLMAGGIFLASMLSAIGRLSFLCEVSFSILRMRRYEYSIILGILHAFAYLGGDQFFNFRGYSLTMTVLKSIVACLKGVIFVDPDALTPSIRNVKTGYYQSIDCPFSENAVSIDIVASFLLVLLQKNVSAKSSSLVSTETYKADQYSSLEELHSTLDSNCDASCGLAKYILLDMQRDSVDNLTLCDISDVISLIELIGCYVSWSWACMNILPQLLKVLESCALENFSAAIVVLLGQLGRFGASACGNKDTGVGNLRSSLARFLRQNSNTNTKASLPVQISIVSALLTIDSFDFESIIQDKLNLPVTDSQFSAVDSIKKWFSSLTQKQQHLSLRVFINPDELKIL